MGTTITNATTISNATSLNPSFAVGQSRYFLGGFWVLHVNKPFLSHAWTPEQRQLGHKESNLPSDPL